MDDKLAEKREILMSLDAYKHRISITRIFQLAKLLHISSAWTRDKYFMRRFSIVFN